MKTKTVILAAAIAMSHTAFAQTSTTTSAGAAPPPASSAGPAAENSSVATDSTAAANSDAVKPILKYVGIAHGPGLDFSGANGWTKSGTSADADPMDVEHRPKLLIQTSKNFDFGMEARVVTSFKHNNTGANVAMGSWRLLADIKNVYKDDVFALTLTPRIVLPTNATLRGQKLTVSPDLIASVDITPKNTRFTANAGLEYIHYFHTSGAGADAYLATRTAILAPWLEVDYQLSPVTQLMVSYWPELSAYARQGSPLHTTANEIDVGAYFEVAKGWQLNPFVATEMNGLGANGAAATKNMALNLVVAGTIL